MRWSKTSSRREKVGLKRPFVASNALFLEKMRKFEVKTQKSEMRGQKSDIKRKILEKIAQFWTANAFLFDAKHKSEELSKILEF